MKVRVDDNSLHRFWVSSESDNGVEYCVDICEYPVGLDSDGVMIYNGACGLTNHRIHGCKAFIFNCEPKLKKPENMGKIFRCKHCLAAEEFALKCLKPHLLRADPNLPEDLTP